MIRPRIVGHMVTRNEVNRYLPKALDWLRFVTREPPVVYDDLSDDGTFEYLTSADVIAGKRSDDEPSFEQSEAGFRQAAWNFLGTTANLTEYDWVLCIDADEFVTDRRSGGMGPNAVRVDLWKTVERAMRDDTPALTCKVDEIFGVDKHDNTPMRRTDGLWPTITATRLARWTTEPFDPVVEGGGSIPTKPLKAAKDTDHIGIVHLGYARQADREAKYRRYIKSKGHNRAHVESILKPGRLERSTMTIPPVVREVLP